MARKKPKRRRPPLDESRELVAKGFEHHRAGRLAEAEKCYRAAVKAFPRHAEASHLMGRVLYDLGNAENALPCLEKAAELGPTRATAFNDLGNLLRELGRSEEAVAAYRRVLELEPDHYIAHLHLAHLLKEAGRYEEAAFAYREAARIEPNKGDAHRNLCAVLKSMGDWERAAEACRDWLHREPENPVARHMMAAFSGEATPARADDDYVVKVFDDFADTFDQQLASLNYRGPEQIARALEELDPSPAGNLNVLDAGCGTGLCGPVLRPYAARLVGVDLSDRMLQRARERDLYDELATAELTAFVVDRPDTYDLIVASDTLIYFGELGPVLTALRSSLKPGGRMLFNVERMKSPATHEPGYSLNRHGRYTHSPDYVERCASSVGLQMIDSKFIDLREQAGKPVAGLLIVAGRTASS